MEAERSKKGCCPAIAGFEARPGGPELKNVGDLWELRKTFSSLPGRKQNRFYSCEELIWTNKPSITSLKADSFSGSLERKAALLTHWLACKNLRQQLDKPRCTWTSDLQNSEIVNECLLPQDSKYGGTSLVVQWLRVHAPNARSLGSTPGGGTRTHKPQLRVCMLQLKILHISMKIEAPMCHTKTQGSLGRIN